MNKTIWTGVAAILIIANTTSCGIFRKGSRTKGKAPVSASTVIVSGDTVTILADSPVTSVIQPPVGDSSVASNVADSVTTVVDTAMRATTSTSSMNHVSTDLLPLFNSQTSYNTFSGKAKVHYRGPKENQDFTATIRMEKDKKIWVSIVALGVFEAARALITPDTIILLDRQHKEVTIVPFKDAGKLLPVSVAFSSLQSLLIGDALHASTDLPSTANTTGDLITLMLNTSTYQQQIAFNKTDSTLKQQQMKVGAEGAAGPLLTMDYSDYSVIDNRRFSGSRTINVTDTGGQTRIEMDFNKVEFDQPIEFSFSIPSKYTVKDKPGK